MTVVKCKCCGNDVDKTIAYKVGSQSYYCNEECYNNKQLKDTIKCRFCKKDVPKALAYKVGNFYYCSKNCYDEKQREKLDEGSSKKIKYKPREGTDRREFTDYIQKIYLDNGWNKKKINWTLLMSQAKNILDEHEVWSYTTLTYILTYMYETLGLSLLTAESKYSPLTLIPFYAVEAEEYYNETVELEEMIENFDFEIQIKEIPKNNNCQKRCYQPLDFDD